MLNNFLNLPFLTIVRRIYHYVTLMLLAFALFVVFSILFFIIFEVVEVFISEDEPSSNLLVQVNNIVNSFNVSEDEPSSNLRDHINNNIVNSFVVFSYCNSAKGKKFFNFSTFPKNLGNSSPVLTKAFFTEIEKKYK
jgi:hypothetical protein